VNVLNSDGDIADISGTDCPIISAKHVLSAFDKNVPPPAVKRDIFAIYSLIGMYLREVTPSKIIDTLN
jgi:hypothetical protein